jgi:putative ABC transport system permease protein
VTSLGNTLHASTLALDMPVDASRTLVTLLVQSQSGGGQRSAGPMYVATPQLLRHYGINPDQIDPDTDIITSRVGLDATPDTYLATIGPSRMTDPHALPHPTIQTIANLPADTDEPNLLITEHALRQLGSVSMPAGWLVRTSQPLTSEAINTARQTAAGIGDEIDIEQAQPSLAELSDWAIAAGILLALGVLAMTIGLIRRESAGDLRTLTAIGAARGTRRMLTATTSGALGLLGGVIGTAVAYLGALAYYRQDLSAFQHVPMVDLALILLGLPLVAAIGGWLFAGRETAAIARQPLT